MHALHLSERSRSPLQKGEGLGERFRGPAQCTRPSSIQGSLTESQRDDAFSKTGSWAVNSLRESVSS